MPQREIVHRLTKCFQALPLPQWRGNLLWHAGQANPVLCGPDFDWYLRYGFGAPAVLAVTREDLADFKAAFSSADLPGHLKTSIVMAHEALCAPFGLEIYQDTLREATQTDVYEAIMALGSVSESP